MTSRSGMGMPALLLAAPLGTVPIHASRVRDDMYPDRAGAALF